MKKLTCLLLTICLLCAFSVMYVGAETTATEIEFVEHVFPRCSTITDFQYTAVRSERDLEALCMLFEDANNQFCEFVNELPEGYFEEKALIVVSHIGESGAKYAVESIIADRSLMEVNYTYQDGGASDILQYLIVAEVNQADIPEYCFYIRAAYREIPVEAESVDFVQYSFFNGRIREDALAKYLMNGQTSILYGEYFMPVSASTLEEFNAFYADYESLSDSDEFAEFAEGLTEEYFAENTLVLFYAQDEADGYTYEVNNVVYNGKGVSLHYVHSSKNDVMGSMFKENIIAVELKKSDVPVLEETYRSDVIKAHALHTEYGTMPAHMIGDINGGFEISASDYLMLKRIILGAYDYSGETELEIKFLEHRCDINGDGGINSIDYLLLKRYLLGAYEIVQ